MKYISRSAVFDRMLDQDMMETQTGEVDIFDVDPETLKQMLEFIYTGQVQFTCFRHFQNYFSSIGGRWKLHCRASLRCRQIWTQRPGEYSHIQMKCYQTWTPRWSCAPASSDPRSTLTPLLTSCSWPTGTPLLNSNRWQQIQTNSSLKTQKHNS